MTNLLYFFETLSPSWPLEDTLLSFFGSVLETSLKALALLANFFFVPSLSSEQDEKPFLSPEDPAPDFELLLSLSELEETAEQESELALTSPMPDSLKISELCF